MNRILETVEDTVGNYVDEFGSAGRKHYDEALAEFLGSFKSKFGLIPDEQDIAQAVKNPDEAKIAILAKIKNDLDEKIILAGKDNLNTFIRYQYLQAIDKKWLDHLENLEALREAVSLRSYGQKNPLTEYKLEGFDIFYQMLDDIRLEIASRICLVKVRVDGNAPPVRQARAISGSAQHNAFGSFAGGSGSASGGGKAGPMAQSAPQNAQVIRTVPKVGRNEQCPCGSGKKYKYCHGA
jgi:preprotein translocase subunit SecA